MESVLQNAIRQRALATEDKVSKGYAKIVISILKIIVLGGSFLAFILIPNKREIFLKILAFLLDL
jgi:hypothetical protein